MPRKPKPLVPPLDADDPEESQRFIDMAREVGADEGPEGRKAFDRTFDKMTKRDKDGSSQARRAIKPRSQGGS